MSRETPRRSMRLVLALAICFAGGLLVAAPARRARPPEFKKSTSDVFFPDAREKLSGTRPDYGAEAPDYGAEAPVAGTPAQPMPGEAPAATGQWSQWIAAEAVEDEIKSLQIKLAEAVQSPTQFKGGQYQKAREHFSMLAAMFAIAAEYDGSIRWQHEAPGLRDLLARAGFNCKVGTDASYKEAKQRSEDLANLVRGDSIELPTSSGELLWPKVADRPPLMKRLEQAQEQTLAPGTASSNEFSRQAERLQHEAQIVAAIAAVIAREGYEFADDATYREHAQSMQTHAQTLRAAAGKNYEQGRQAAGELSKSCAACHDGYRS